MSRLLNKKRTTNLGSDSLYIRTVLQLYEQFLSRILLFPVHASLLPMFGHVRVFEM
jgi:hypothetical protein